MWYSWWQCVLPALDPSSMIAQSHLENRCVSQDDYSSMATFNIQIRRAQHFTTLFTYTHITQLPFWIWSEADGHKQCSCVYSKDGVGFRFCLSFGKLRWFPHNIRAIMAKIKLPKKTLSMVVFWIKVRRSYRDLSSQADPARENWTWSYPYFS